MIGSGMFGETTFAGDADETTTVSWIEMAGALGDARVFGPDYITDINGDPISAPGVYVVPLSLEVAARSAPATVLSTVADTFARSFNDEVNDTGSGSVAYANTDTVAVAQLVSDRLVTFLVYGVRAFSMLVESRHRVTIAEGEEHDQITAVIGRGHLAIMEEAVVYPSRGTDIQPIEEDRTFNWSTPSPVYDDSGWGYSHQITDVATAQVIWPQQPFADGWPDPATGVIWAMGATHLIAPPGYCYFRRDFTAPADGFYLFHAACDNEGELWLDGQQVLTLGGFLSTFTYLVFMTAGAHTLAARGLNYTAPGGGGQGPAGLIVAIYTTDANGDPATLVLRSDATWKIVAYPAVPPGMFVGEAIHVVFDEVVARGCIPEVTLMFTETTDSAGQAWPEVLDIATKVGTSFLVFLIELTATYIDIWMKPGTFELYAWRRGTRQQLAGLTLAAPSDPTDPTSGNMYEQTHTVLE